MNQRLLDYFNGDDLAASVWLGKYALKNHKKETVETTPEEMHRRLAKEFARIEKINEAPRKKFEHLSEFGLLNYGPLSEEQIYNYFDRFKYIVPQGSIMSQLGNPYSVGSLSNCFVIPPPVDSYGGILYTDQQLVQLMKRRGGVGTNLDLLRPEDTPVNNAAGTSTGSDSFMDRYSNTTREVAQNGRRGALMLLMSCRHPSIFKFVTKKKDKTKVTGANISTMLSDEFLRAVEAGEDYLCTFPVDLHFSLNPKDLVGYDYNKLYTMLANDGTEFLIMKIKAKELFDLIVEMAWENAEPGVAFMDRVHKYSPEGVYEALKAIASNPCGEQWMQAYDACRLLAINLFNVVDHPFTSKAKVNFDRLYEISYIQQRLADDIVDLEIEKIDAILAKIDKDPEPEYIKVVERDLWTNIRKTAAESRRTGCGFTALGDMLAAVGLKYDSEEGIALIEQVMKTKMRAELDCTIDLAITRGAFKGWDCSQEFKVTVGTKTPFVESKGMFSSALIEGYLIEGKNEFYEMLVKEFPEQVLRMINFGRRNINWSTVAPTGTVSLMTQTTSGIEPVFMLWYMRRKKVNPSDPGARVDFVDQNGDCWTEYAVIHPKFREWLRTLVDGDDHIDLLSNETLEHYAKQSPWYGSTANDIDWIKRVEIQGIVQKYTTNAISSTINLPNDVTKEKVAEIYMAAWKAGLKGVTIYRDGCRTGVLVSDTEKKESFQSHNAPKRPDSLPCDVYHVTAKGTRWTVIVGLMEGKPYEIFAINKEAEDIPEKIKAGNLTKEGKGYYTLSNEKYTIKNVNASMEDDEEAITRMISTALRHGAAIDFVVEQLNKTHGTVVSFSKAIARTLAKYSKPAISKEKCNECGSTNTRKEEGCSKCLDCGSSKCG